MSALLAGARVLELATGAAAAACGRLFAQWGAEVVAVEPSGGWPLRQEPPLAPARDGTLISLAFTHLMLDKALAPTLAKPEVERRMDWAEVLVTDDAGLDGARMRKDHPGLVVVRLSPISSDVAPGGPGFADIEALSGYLSLNGPAGGPPLPAPGHMLDMAVGAAAFVAALGHLCSAQRGRGGALIEVSALEAVSALLPFLRVQHLGVDMHRQGGTAEGVRLLRCRDGWVSLLLPPAAYRDIYAEVLGITGDALPADLYEGEFDAVVARVQGLFAPYLLRLDRATIFAGLQAKGVVCGEVRSLAEVLTDPQLAARQALPKLEHPQLGTLIAAAEPAWIDGYPPRAPSLARDATCATARAAPRPHPPADRAGPARPPLDGLRVIDLTQAWMGPFASLLLADLGAEVIKIESPTRPDIWRLAGQSLPDSPVSPINRSHYFNSVNRNKRSLAVDLATPDGRALLLDLVAQADVVMETYSPGVLARLGLGREVLQAARADLVIAAFSGFGGAGPLASEKANGASIEALAGWCALNHDAAGDPVGFGFYQADPLCGLQMAGAILAALHRRAATGEGATIDGAMLDAAAGYIGPELMAASLGVRLPQHRGGPLALPRTLAEVLRSPSPLRADWFRTLSVPGLGAFRYNGPPWRSDSPAPAATPPPRLGEHGRAVLAERLGLTPDRLDGLEADGVLGRDDCL